MHIEITTSGFELTPELDKYTRRKLAHITRRIPRGLREEAQCLVRFKQSVVKDEKINACAIKVTAGDIVFDATETTLHAYAAFDIVAAHVENELKMYRAAHSKWGALTRIRRTFKVL